VQDDLARILDGWKSDEAVYIGLLFMLFVAPRFLQRYRIPSALTALLIGAVAGPGLGLLHEDPTVNLLSTLGIVALFLFAGLDVAPRELARESRTLVEHVIVGGAALAGVGWLVSRTLGLEARPALLVALALLTPSTGFILDSLVSWGSSDSERFWIRSKAIAAELMALAVLFVALQSTSLARLALSALIMAAMVALLPWIFRWFATVLVPYAPKSEFGFLIMVAVTCAVVTRSLGVYYLVGAFVVGVAARQFRNSLPALASDRMVTAIEAFGSLFVPFYFFHAGSELVRSDFSQAAALTGLVMVVLFVPFRLALVVVHRLARLGETVAQSQRIGIAMMPTTVFALVIVDILRDRFQAPSALLGGLVVYTVVATAIPGLFLKVPMADFDQELLGAQIDPDPAPRG
jgi:Kef-type K+ transport system membrane component KefB